MNPMQWLLASALALTLNLAQAAPSGTLYTANEQGHSLSQIDLASGVVKTFALDLAPHNVQVSPDGRWLLVVGMPLLAAECWLMKKYNAAAMRPHNREAHR